jgi:trichohyalin
VLEIQRKERERARDKRLSHDKLMENKEYIRVQRMSRERVSRDELSRQRQSQDDLMKEVKGKEKEDFQQKRRKKDGYLENNELLKVKRKAKQEQAHQDRLRARESQENTIKNLQKKAYDREKNKRLMADKYIDNRELERVKRTAKKEAEWEARAKAQENEEATKHTMEKKM